MSLQVWKKCLYNKLLLFKPINSKQAFQKLAKMTQMTHMAGYMDKEKKRELQTHLLLQPVYMGNGPSLFLMVGIKLHLFFWGGGASLLSFIIPGRELHKREESTSNYYMEIHKTLQVCREHIFCNPFYFYKKYTSEPRDCSTFFCLFNLTKMKV